MQNNTMETVSSTFLGIVEKLTFMFGEQIPKSEIQYQGIEFTHASMSFHGDLVGQLFVAVPTALLPEIAANILGLEPEDVKPDGMLDDALAEMLNVVCGHVIMDLVGTEANFKLASPETKVLNEGAMEYIMDNDNFIGFELDDSPVFFGLNLES